MGSRRYQLLKCNVSHFFVKVYFALDKNIICYSFKLGHTHSALKLYLFAVTVSNGQPLTRVYLAPAICGGLENLWQIICSGLVVQLALLVCLMYHAKRAALL